MNRSRPEQAARLAARRRMLLTVSQRQRGLLSAHWAALTEAPTWLKLARNGWRYAQAHPWAVVLPLGALLALRPQWARRLAAATPALAYLARALR